MLTVQVRKVIFKLVPRSEKEKGREGGEGGNELTSRGKILPMVLEAKIQGDCAIAQDVYHTNKLCQFCLIDPHTEDQVS